MQTRIQKWGNSLAVRIPKSFAAEVNLEQDTPVDIAVQGDTLVLTPVRNAYTLEALLAQVTEENLHSEEDWGSSVGREEW